MEFKEVLYRIAGFFFLCPLAHFVAAIIVIPPLFCIKSKLSVIKRFGIFLLIIAGWAVYLSSPVINQFGRSPATIGLVLGAVVNVILLAFVAVKILPEPPDKLSFLALYLTPIVGFYTAKHLYG